MGAILAIIAALVAIAFAAWPLLKGRGGREHDLLPEQELLFERDLALNDIREVDFDRDLGNLSDEDYRELRDRYKRHAVAILKQLNAQEGQLDDEIEQAVAALRRQPSANP